jgi:phosphoribosyl-ATP pyrophosphohydrolase/phosphoribosyl-AMP cyclohydrolase
VAHRIEDQHGQLTATELESVRYDKATGLVPVVVQDVHTGAVLMLAYTNREALKRTFGTGQAWFWSRSRGEYWHKGATSGNVQRVVEVRLDCDGDAVLYLVDPAGPACHTGSTSCFYRRVEYKGEPPAAGATGAVESGSGPNGADVSAAGGASAGSESSPLESNVELGRGKDNGATDSVDSVDSVDDEPDVSVDVLNELWSVVSRRWVERPQGSYTTYLFEQGVDKIAKKVGEEGIEVVIAAKNAVQSEHGRTELAEESADLLYHLFALWKAAGIAPEYVYRVLQKRAR